MADSLRSRYDDTKRGLARLAPRKISARSEATRAEARAFWRYAFASWAEFFFSELLRAKFSDFHKSVIQAYLESVADPVEARQGQKHAIAAPRGSAKSTVISFLQTIHAMLYGLEPYQVIYASTAKQARQRTANVRDALLQNEALRKFYRYDISEQAGAEGFECNGCRFECYGLRDASRGLNWRGARPTRVILDDVEDDEESRSLATREMIADRFEKIVDHIGTEATNFFVVGTLIYPDSLLSKIGKRPDYAYAVFRSIEAEPQRTDLWGDCRDIYMDLHNPRREKDAERFYKARKKLMDAGATVLWPEWEGLFALQMQRWSKGEYAFESEKQNNPLNPDLVVVRKEWFRYFAGMPPKGCGWYVIVDPAFSKRHTADEAAVLVCAKDADGYLYIWGCESAKWGPADTAWRIVNKAQAVQSIAEKGAGSFEGAFIEQMVFLRDFLEKEQLKTGFHFPLVEIEPVRGEGPDVQSAGQPKRRIKALAPYYQAGHILHHESLRGSKVEAQLIFPAGEHDDCADCVAHAARVTKEGTRPEQKRAAPAKNRLEEYEDALKRTVARVGGRGRMSVANW